MAELATSRLAHFEQALLALIVRFGAEPGPVLSARVHDAVEQLSVAIRESAADGESLSPLDVVRIRASKLAARSLPAALYREPARLAALRAEIHQLSSALVGESGGNGSRFL